MFVEKPPLTDDITELRKWLERLQYKLLLEDLHGSATWNPGSLSSGEHEAKNVTVTGAQLGDYAIASFSLDMTHLDMTSHVISADTVQVIISNHHSQAVDIAEGTLYVRVFRRTT